VIVTLNIQSDVSDYFNATFGGFRYKAVSDGLDLDAALSGWQRTTPVTFSAACGPGPVSSGTSNIQATNLVVAPALGLGFATVTCAISFTATIPAGATRLRCRNRCARR
jgi:hypothetical protein